MKRIAYLLFGLGIIALATTFSGCGVLKSLNDLQHLQFKLDKATNFRVNGIDVARFSKPSDISPMDYAALGLLLTQKKFPVDFTVNVIARNPNPSSTTAGSTTSSSTIGLRRLAWTLLIDDRTTINGVVDKLIQIPGDGQSTVIPIGINLDLYQFFADKGLTDLLNLALAIGGAQGTSSRLKLQAKVSVQTPIGTIDYPDAITIVDTKFSN